MMAGVKSTRKVTQRARKNVRFNPKGVTDNKRKSRKTTPKKRSSPRRGAVGSPRGEGLLTAGPQRNGPLRKPRSTIKRKTNRTKGVSKIALPKTPVRVSSKARSKAGSRASKTAAGGRRLPGLPQLILRAALHSAQPGGITMAALQHVLADGGYDVSKNNARVRMTLKGLVGKGALLHRAGSRYKLSTKGAGEKMKTTAVRTTTKGTLSGRRGGKAIKASKPASKSTPRRKPAKQARKSPTKVKKQAGRKPMRATKAKKPRARKGKTTLKARRTRSS